MIHAMPCMPTNISPPASLSFMHGHQTATTHSLQLSHSATCSVTACALCKLDMQCQCTQIVAVYEQVDIPSLSSKVRLAGPREGRLIDALKKHASSFQPPVAWAPKANGVEHDESPRVRQGHTR